MKTTASTDLGEVQTIEELKRFVSIALTDHARILNGMISFSDNLQPNLISATFLAANTETSFPHNLGKVPRGYIPVSLSANMVVYDGSTKNDSNRFYLKANATGVAKLWVF